ncbi:Uma2 family endonuclease [Plantactinospora sp. GCM10030261]|uniref:Uma2 family endonuclease n=1 Tax=Plantactinospora sp. GCM10030261 TaxID=3273420 RepID=UPI00361D97AA
MGAQAAFEWPTPPPGGYTADDLDRLPNLPPHTELIDGSLVLVSPQKVFHTLALDLLVQGLRRTVPKNLRVRREMCVTLGLRQRLEPDVLVVAADAETSPDQTWYPPDAVDLVVEVVSPDSEERDRDRKPTLYARAGIRHFWRVEDISGGKVAVYVYELDPATHTYALTGIYHDRIQVGLPFDIDIDLTEIERL